MIWGSERDILTWNGTWRRKLMGVLTKTKYVNAFYLSPAAVTRCVTIINNFKPHMIRGYASSLLVIAEYIRENNIKCHKPTFVVSSAETLTRQMRNVIENAFDCKVHDLYGSREAAALAGECRSGLMHTFAFNHRLEVVDDNDNDVEPGDAGPNLPELDYIVLRPGVIVGTMRASQ